MGASGTAELDAELGYLDGFITDEADLWVRDLPEGIKGRFERDPLTHAGRSTLLLEGDGTADSGLYAITVGVSAGDHSVAIPISLQVTDRPGFELVLSPADQWVDGERGADYTIRAQPRNGFEGPIAWAVDRLPTGVDVSIQSAPLNARIRVKSSAAVPPGSHRFQILGSALGQTVSVPATLTLGGTQGSWRTSQIGSTGASNNTVRVGPARNDGVRRVYVGTVTDGRVYEFSRTRSRWRRRLVGSSMGGREIHNMTIGKGRNDGRRRIYACSTDGHLYEFTWASSGWVRRTVGEPTGGCFHAVVGPGRGGTEKRVYAARGNEVWEYTWNAASSDWKAVLVGAVAADSSGVIAHGVEMGDGRNDGRMRLYIASDANGTFEATHGEAGWQITPMGDTGDIRNVSVGPGRNDGRQRVYAGVVRDRAGFIREFTWENGDWVIRSIGENDPIQDAMVHAYVINARGDGRRRVYGAGGDGNVYEFTRVSTHWHPVVVGGGGEYMYGFHFGKRARSTRMRLYSADFGGRVFEFTWRV